MKYTWEEGDIIPGRAVLKENHGNVGKMKSYLICWTNQKFEMKLGDERYFLAIMGEDGMCLNPFNRKDLAKRMTEMNCIPVETLPPEKKSGYDSDGYDEFRSLKGSFNNLVRFKR